MLQRGRQLPADVGQILRIAHTVGLPVEAADAAIPAVSDLAAFEHVGAVHSLGPVGDAERPFLLLGPGPQDEVGRRARLARTEDRTGSALDDLDTLDGVVHA